VCYNYSLPQLSLSACLNCSCVALHVPPCRTAGDKFNKEYAYNVRYNYGQEGKRQDWSEWSCVKIINQVWHQQHRPCCCCCCCCRMLLCMCVSYLWDIVMRCAAAYVCL
jgi:DNA primase large subunit